jgi:hypothetical protein
LGEAPKREQNEKRIRKGKAYPEEGNKENYGLGGKRMSEGREEGSLLRKGTPPVLKKGILKGTRHYSAIPKNEGRKGRSQLNDNTVESTQCLHISAVKTSHVKTNI